MSNPDAPLNSLSSSKRSRLFLVAWAIAAALLAGFHLFNGNAPVAILWVLGSLMAVTMLIWSYSATLVRVYADGLEVKMAPLAPLRFAGFDQMASIRETKRDIFVKLLRGKGKKEIKIPRFALEKEDQEWLVQKLKYELAAS